MDNGCFEGCIKGAYMKICSPSFSPQIEYDDMKQYLTNIIFEKREIFLSTYFYLNMTSDPSYHILDLPGIHRPLFSVTLLYLTG